MAFFSLEKREINRSALLPLPEAKMANLFILRSLTFVTFKVGDKLFSFFGKVKKKTHYLCACLQ